MTVAFLSTVKSYTQNYTMPPESSVLMQIYETAMSHNLSYLLVPLTSNQ